MIWTVLIIVGVVFAIGIYFYCIVFLWDGTIYTSTTTETRWEFDRPPKLGEDEEIE